ncbi:hypothetical protein Fbal_2936 [Ferrimonas balearica DSM 9799]|uniref:Uncharacterized protein n=1 Tax=Ferrimonas balearica (strain DSM 9799 / CCM 4581 / KCTC 23876 / PAT) TaxID=550540 RepID=E1STA4_FERBD|nr:hypothetical protein Fbal_2936 [Ferrimonas balearica DSM 9799]
MLSTVLVVLSPLAAEGFRRHFKLHPKISATL